MNIRSTSSHGSGPRDRTASTFHGVGRNISSKLEVLGTSRGDIFPTDELSCGKRNRGFHGKLDNLTGSGFLGGLGCFTATRGSNIDSVLFSRGGVSINGDNLNTSTTSTVQTDTCKQSSGSSWWDEVSDIHERNTSSKIITCAPSTLSSFSRAITSGDGRIVSTNGVCVNTSTSSTSTCVTSRHSEGSRNNGTRNGSTNSHSTSFVSPCGSSNVLEGN